MGLRIAPSLLSAEARPAALLECPGDVARLDEQVIEPESMLRDLADQQRGRVLKIDSNSGLEFVCRGPGEVELIRLLDPESGAPLDLRPGRVIFTAGAGNAALREMTGLDGRTMQRRPLHMVMVRGALPPLNGHCVDGASTRVTITSTVDCQDRVLWQIGGQLSELGATMSREQIIERAREEIAEVLPGIDVEGAAWASYCVDRAENRTASGRRPDSPAFSRAGNTVTGWPIKLALVPVLVQQIVEDLGTPAAVALRHDATALDRVQSWPHPAVALPPWERCPSWSCAP